MKMDKEYEFGEQSVILSYFNLAHLRADEASLLSPGPDFIMIYVFCLCGKQISCTMIPFFLVPALYMAHVPFAQRLTAMLNKMKHIMRNFLI